MVAVDQWAWSADHRQACRIIETQELWGERVARVWLPGRDEVVRVPAGRLSPLESAPLASFEEPPRDDEQTLDVW